jgi:hypothetical protein
MVRAGSWLLAVAAAVAPARTGCRAPRASLQVERYGGKPEMVLLRCRVSGVSHPRYEWTIGNALHTVGWSPPRDQPALLVTLDAKAQPPALAASCRATGDDGVIAEAATELAPISVRTVTPPKRPGEPLSVEGGGFGANRGADDALWLRPEGGARVAADHACKGASWSDGKILACLPPGMNGRIDVRVESGGRLAGSSVEIKK